MIKKIKQGIRGVIRYIPLQVDVASHQHILAHNKHQRRAAWTTACHASPPARACARFISQDARYDTISPLHLLHSPLITTWFSTEGADHLPSLPYLPSIYPSLLPLLLTFVNSGFAYVSLQRHRELHIS